MTRALESHRGGYGVPISWLPTRFEVALMSHSCRIEVALADFALILAKRHRWPEKPQSVQKGDRGWRRRGSEHAPGMHQSGNAFSLIVQDSIAKVRMWTRFRVGGNQETRVARSARPPFTHHAPRITFHCWRPPRFSCKTTLCREMNNLLNLPRG